MKKIIGIVVLIVLCLSGGIWILAMKESKKLKSYMQEREIRARYIKRNYDDAIAVINGSKPRQKMMKV